MVRDAVASRFPDIFLDDRLRGDLPLTVQETLLLRKARHNVDSIAAGATLTDAHSAAKSHKVLETGWACRERMTLDGRRQILSILLPGDLLGDFDRQRPLDLIPVVAITPLRVIDIGEIVATVRAEPEAYPGFVAAFKALRLLEERRLIDQFVRLGSHLGAARVASLFLELFERCAAIGLVDGSAFAMPLTQGMIGDALGLSVVHVNRVIRLMKQDNMIRFHGATLELLDFAKLGDAAGAEPRYRAVQSAAVGTSA